jgi:hypothetical protein
MVSNPLTAIGTFLVNTMMQQLKSVRQAGGEELNTQLTQSAAGRKLLQVRAPGAWNNDNNTRQPFSDVYMLLLIAEGHSQPAWYLNIDARLRSGSTAVAAILLGLSWAALQIPN